MKTLIAAVCLGVSCMYMSCTDNTQARTMGGTMTVNLKRGERFINVTWKGDSLWVLTETCDSSSCGTNGGPSCGCPPPQMYSFKEHSATGFLEGKVIIQEK